MFSDMGLLILFFVVGLGIAIVVVVLAKKEGYDTRANSPHKKDCPKKCCSKNAVIKN